MRAWRRAVDRLGGVVATFCILVVFAAGGSAVALLLLPDDTDSYFSWTLRPPAAAAAIGGLYLASSVVFAWALTLEWRQARPLFVGVIGLTTPTFILTVIHNEVFDFDRWQAVVWLLLFAGAPISAVLILVTHPVASGGAPLRTWARTVLTVLCAVFVVLAIVIWFDTWRDDVSRHSPMELRGLTGTYLGAWCSFTAALTGWAAVRNRWDDARLPIVALGAAAGGVTVALLRSVDELHSPAASISVTVALVIVAILLYRTSRAS